MTPAHRRMSKPGSRPAILSTRSELPCDMTEQSFSHAWTTILAERQDAPNGGSARAYLARLPRRQRSRRHVRRREDGVGPAYLYGPHCAENARTCGIGRAPGPPRSCGHGRAVRPQHRQAPRPARPQDQSRRAGHVERGITLGDGEGQEERPPSRRSGAGSGSSGRGAKRYRSGGSV